MSPLALSLAYLKRRPLNTALNLLFSTLLFGLSVSRRYINVPLTSLCSNSGNCPGVAACSNCA